MDIQSEEARRQITMMTTKTKKDKMLNIDTEIKTEVKAANKRIKAKVPPKPRVPKDAISVVDESKKVVGFYTETNEYGSKLLELSVFAKNQVQGIGIATSPELAAKRIRKEFLLRN